MKIKIVSEGSHLNTKVINVENGEPIDDICEIKWECKIGHLATVEIKFTNIPVEVIGETDKGR